MGCEVVSVYADEVNGVIGYPQQILDDLMKRDFSSALPLKPLKETKFNIYGFTQSYAIGDIYTCVINKREYFLYCAGRFLIKWDIKSSEQKCLMHDDKIVCIDVKGKLCATGSVGGRLLIWDLQYLEKKIQLLLPEESVNISSIGITNKYIFCSDSSQPKNNIYCFDLRTAKIKGQSYLGSFQPTFRGKTWKSDHFVTASADGLWFTKYSASDQALDITKGMFRIYPKTSMVCLDVVDDTYIVSGGVDGYVFLWAEYQCQRVLRAGEDSISSLHICQNNLIVSSFNNNVKCFSFQIKRKEKPEEDEIKHGQITDDFVAIVIDSFERSAPLQSICSSILDPSIYYGQTRNGVLFDKMIPSPEYMSKIKSYELYDRNYITFNQSASKSLYHQSIWLLSTSYNKFKVEELKYEKNDGWVKKDEYWGCSSFGYTRTKKKLALFIPQLMHVFFVKQSQISYSELKRSDANDDLADKIVPKTITKLEVREGINEVQNNEGNEDNQRNEVNEEVLKITVDGIVDVNIDGKVYVIVFFKVQYSVFIYDEAEITYKQVMNKEYQQQGVKEVQIEGEKIEFEEVDGVIEIKSEEEEISKINRLHCVKDAIIWSTEKGEYITIGGETMISHIKS